MTAKNRPLRGIRHETSQAPRYFFPRVPTTTDKRDPSTNKPYEVGSFGIVGRNPINGIPVKTGTEGQYWYLSKFDTNGDAIWLPFSTGSSGAMVQLNVDTSTVPGTNPVLPAVDGTFYLNGAVVAAHSVPIETHSRAVNTANIEVQVAASVTGAPGTKTAAGLAQFDDTAFVVDADGYVTLAGGAGPAADSFAVDNATVPGTNPVLPSGAGQVTINGAVVAAHSVPVDIHSRAANTYNVEVQVAGTNTGAPASKAKAGLSQYDDTQFTVDSDGYVGLLGTAVGQTITGDTGGALSPTAGNWDIFGRIGTNTSGTGSTLSIDADGSGKIGYVNLGLFYSLGTATLKGADGNDLSATNPAYITIRSNVTNGTLVTYPITTNFTFDDASGAASVFAGSLFGMTTLDTTTGDRATPFYMYAVADNTDANLTFVCSRYPGTSKSVTQSGATLKDAASGNADDFRDNLALEVLGASITNYDGQNATQLGSFTMLINGADDWVIQSLSPVTGIGRDLGSNNMVHSKGIMGQATNSYFLNNSGTAPTDTTALDNQYIYRIDQFQNLLYIKLDTTFAGAPAGVVDAIINIPIIGPNSQKKIGMDATLIIGGNYYQVKLTQVGTTYGTTNRQFYLQKTNGTTGRWQYDEFSVGDRLLISDTLMLS